MTDSQHKWAADLNTLARHCASMQKRCGGQPFELSGSTAGRLLGRSGAHAGKILRVLVRDGVINLVERGALAGKDGTPRPSTYRVTETPTTAA